MKKERKNGNQRKRTPGRKKIIHNFSNRMFDDRAIFIPKRTKFKGWMRKTG